MPVYCRNQKGIVSPALLIVVIGLVGFLLIATTFDFNLNFKELFLKPFSKAAGNGITITQELKLSRTFHSIAAELIFADDDNANAKASLEFKKKTETTWRKGLDMWRTDGVAIYRSPADNVRAFYGSALLLEPGVAYDVRVTVTDPDGGNVTKLGSITTRAEDIKPAADLVPTHYVRTDGNDLSLGTSNTPTGAWRTIEKAWKDAPSNAVVQVGPGFFSSAKTVRTLPITMKAQFPALDDNRNIINSGQRTVIEPIGPDGFPSTSGKTGATDPDLVSATIKRVAPWQQVTLTGPGLAGAPAGATYRVWKWANSPIAYSGGNDVRTLGYTKVRQDPPTRLAFWNNSGTDVQTPEGWAEKVYTNKSYNYGYYQQGVDLYLRMPDVDNNGLDDNPNDYYITGGSESATRGFSINGPDIRITGFDMRQNIQGVRLSADAKRVVVDHTILTGNKIGIVLDAVGLDVIPSTYASDLVFEYNLFINRKLAPTSSDTPTNPVIPWKFVKGDSSTLDDAAIINADGTGYKGAIGRDNETSAVQGTGGAMHVVVRRNTLESGFDFIGNYNPNFDRYSHYNTDVYENVMSKMGDDPFDTSRNNINYKIWGNKIRQAFTAASIDANFGPLYLFRNEFFDIGDSALGRDKLGRPAPNAVMFKYGGHSRPTARVYILHNTLWTDGQIVSGGSNWAGDWSEPQAMYFRNNIMRTTGKVFSTPCCAWAWNESSNYFATKSTSTSDGLKYLGEENTFYRENVAGYRNRYATANPGQTTNTNVSWNQSTGKGHFADVSVIDTSLNNAAAGDFALRSTSPFIDSGVIVPNISDIAGVNYRGALPDLGALESGTTQATPPPSNTPTIAPPTTIPTPTPTPFIPTPTPNTTQAPTLPPTGTTTLLPTDDSYVMPGSPNTSFGSAITLQMDNEPVEISYLMFDLSSLVGKTITSAKLQLTAANGSLDTMNVRLVDNTAWTESGLTYNNRPSPSSLITSFTGVSTGSVTNIDLTSIVNTKKGNLLSLSIDNPGADGFDVHSKEAAAGKPVLVVTYSGGTLEGDTNGDNRVDIFDYNNVLRDYGKTGTGLIGDADKDGDVDIFDYNLVLKNYGKSI